MNRVNSPIELNNYVKEDFFFMNWGENSYIIIIYLNFK